MNPSFPLKGITTERMEEILDFLEKRTSSHYLPQVLSLYDTTPHPLAQEAIKKFLKFNQNNSGTHTREASLKRNGTCIFFEKEVVSMLGDLFALPSADGYITQGGSEGNLMGLWVGRNKLRINKYSQKKICLLKTVLSHFSVDKAIDILNIHEIVNVPLDDNYAMSCIALRQTLEVLSKKGWSEFIIVLTLGYNTTGTVDPLDKIDPVIRNAENDLGIKTYTHLDAAIGGMVYPFSSAKPLDFRYRSLQSISLDMHKNGLVPHTAGVFLCRQGLQKWVEHPAPYLIRKKSDTVSTSRPGVAAIACWVVLRSLGRKGFQDIVRYEFALKQYLSQLIEKNKDTLRPFRISHQAIHIVAYSFEAFPKGIIPPALKKKYRLSQVSLTTNDGEKKVIYPIVLMPHITRKALKGFVNDIQMHV